jgi:hypothetical protein
MLTTMKKRFVTVITIIAVAVAFSLCMGFDSHASTKSVYKPITTAYYKLYSGAWTINKAPMTAKQTGFAVDGFIYGDSNGYIVPPDGYFPSVGYTYMDINHDGKKELVIGSYGTHSGKPKNLKNILIYSIWTQKNGKAKFLKSANYRCQLMITGNNKICYEMSGGYNYTLYKFYKISGTTLKYTGKRVNGKWETNTSKKLSNWSWVQ